MQGSSTRKPPRLESADSGSDIFVATLCSMDGTCQCRNDSIIPGKKFCQTHAFLHSGHVCKSMDLHRHSKTDNRTRIRRNKTNKMEHIDVEFIMTGTPSVRRCTKASMLKTGESKTMLTKN